MNIIRIISTLIWYFFFFACYHYVITWINPNITDLVRPEDSGGRVLYTFLGLVWMFAVLFVSEIYDRQQGCRSDFLDYLYGRK